MWFHKRRMDFVKLLPYTLLVVAAGAELCLDNSTTPTCQLWHQIQLSLDETVNPCDDFLGYVCNNYQLHHNSYQELVAAKQMDSKLVNVMESLYPQPVADGKQSIFDKAYIYYKSCVNEEQPTNLLRYLEVIKPGKRLEWPLMEELQAYRRGDTNFAAGQWSASQFDVYALLGQLQSYGLNNVLIHHKLYDSDSVLRLDVAELRGRRGFSLQKLINQFKSWGLPEESALQYAEDILDTEEYLDSSLYQNYTSRPQSKQLTYRQLKRQFPYLAVFLENTYRQTFRNSFIVRLVNKRYFQFLLNTQWSGKKARDVCNYLMMTFLSYLVLDKAADFSPLDCIKDLKHKLDFPVSLLYYQYVYKPDELFYNREIYDLFNRTLHYAMDVLQENHLKFPSRTLDEIRTNMSAIRLNIGNLPRNLRTQEIEKFFANIPALELDNYYKNHLHLLRHRVLKALLPRAKQSFSIIDDNIDYWFVFPFFSYPNRMVIIPFGLFNPPIYHYSYDPLFKWSLLGSQLGHAVTVAVLDNAFKSNDWLQAHDCIADALDKEYSVHTIAYLVGAHVAYKAYANEQRYRLQPEFSHHISWKKLFFLNLSQHFCGRNNAEYVSEYKYFPLLSDFHEAFQCPEGSKMNPKPKCRLI